jgi:hypothetical protein
VLWLILVGLVAFLVELYLIGQLKCFFDRTYSYFNPDFSSRVPRHQS